LKEFGFSEAIEAKKKLIKAVENISKGVQVYSVEKIATNPSFKQGRTDPTFSDGSNSLNPIIYAPIPELKNKLKTWGMLDRYGKPKANGAIFRYHDILIIGYFKFKAFELLTYYRLVVNYRAVTKLVGYHLRWSLIHTLAGKHTMKVHEIMSFYGKSPKVVLILDGKSHELASYPTPNDIYHRPSNFLKLLESHPCSKCLGRHFLKVSIPRVIFIGKRKAVCCSSKNIEV